MIRMWIIAFVLTIAVEAVIAALAAPRSLRLTCVRDSVLMNFLTHPLATWLYLDGIAGFVPIECGVLAVETLIYRGITGLAWGRACVLAASCNGVTAALSFLL